MLPLSLSSSTSVVRPWQMVAAALEEGLGFYLHEFRFQGFDYMASSELPFDAVDNMFVVPDCFLLPGRRVCSDAPAWSLQGFVAKYGQMPMPEMRSEARNGGSRRSVAPDSDLLEQFPWLEEYISNRRSVAGRSGAASSSGTSARAPNDAEREVPELADEVIIEVWKTLDERRRLLLEEEAGDEDDSNFQARCQRGGLDGLP